MKWQLSIIFFTVFISLSAMEDDLTAEENMVLTKVLYRYDIILKGFHHWESRGEVFKKTKKHLLYIRSQMQDPVPIVDALPIAPVYHPLHKYRFKTGVPYWRDDVTSVCRWGTKKLVQLYINNGFNPNETLTSCNGLKMPALCIAIQSARNYIVYVLLKAGAYCKNLIVNGKKYSPFFVPIEEKICNGIPKVSLHEQQLIAMLMQFGADPYEMIENNKTAIAIIEMGDRSYARAIKDEYRRYILTRTLMPLLTPFCNINIKNYRTTNTYLSQLPRELLQELQNYGKDYNENAYTCAHHIAQYVLPLRNIES